MNKFSFFLLSLLFVGFLSSCDNDDDVSHEHEEGQALSLDLAYNVGGLDFDYQTVYDINGTAISFDFAQFYMSGLNIMDDEGNMEAFADTYILANPEQSTYELGAFASSHIHMLNFNVGVDSLTNNQTNDDFTSYPADSPLALQTPVSMNWSWNVGYVFLKINAMVDTNGDGTPNAATEYHIGTDAFLGPVSVMIHEDVDSHEGHQHDEKTIGLNFDIAQLFNDVDLASGVQTHTGDNMELAQKIVANYSSAFSKQ